MSRRRHSGQRATAYRKQGVQQASVGLGSPGDRGKYSKFKRYQNVKDLLERKLAYIKSGVSDQEVAQWAADEEEREEILHSANPDMVALENEQITKQSRKYVVPELGSLTPEREGGTFRFASTQVNSMSTKGSQVVKTHQITRIANAFDVDAVAVGEVGINFGNMPRSKTFDTLFDTEVELRSVSAFNVHENPPTNHQQGGTSILALNTIIPYIKDKDTDWRGLGRWSWMLLEGADGHRTRFVSAYNVGKPKPKGEYTVYQQQLRYIQTHGLNTNPRRMFREDLLHQLGVWAKQGDRLILAMDANEHVLDGQLCRELTNPARGLGLKEVSHDVWGETQPHTWIDGSEPIDGVWMSESIECVGFKMLSFHRSAGDHRTMVFEVTSRSVIGLHEDKIVRSGCRRLSTKNHRSLSKYTKIMHKQMIRHRMEERLDALIAEIGEDQPTPDQKRRMEKLDRQMVEIQKCAERRCRNILKPELEFSPQVKLWSDRMRAYKALIRLREGKGRNYSNATRDAKRAKIPEAKYLGIDELKEGYKYAKARKHQLREHAPELRSTHLRENLAEADAKKQVKRSKAIKRTIDRESQAKMWYWINRSQKDPRAKSIMRPQKLMPDGSVVEATTKEEAEQMIFNETEVRFHLANEAPITKTMLIDQLGYLADTDIARQIVEGTYDIPDEVDDITALVLEEIGRIGVQMSNGEVTITISPEEFQYFWKRVKEGTSSSMSGIHYGHYKAAAKDDKLSAFLSKKITLIARTGCPPERWSHGLTVMLEKIAGLALVNKLRAILLMEADFNFHNKVIFGSRMLAAARDNGLIPQEQFSEKQSTAEDGKFANILATDISRQRRHPMCIISADAANCYDRIQHAIMALVFLCMGVNPSAIAAMLRSIQLMKFFLRTGWGESQTHIGGDIYNIIQGMCQGNGAAPAAWLMLCSVLILVYKSFGYGIKCRAPITHAVMLDSMGVIYVDDTDLMIMNSSLTTGAEVWQESQDALFTWGSLLIATGGSAKPVKSFSYLCDYEWDSAGHWHYTDVVEGCELYVPQPDGTAATIKQCAVTESKKTLGLYTNPAGCCRKQLEVWIDTIRTWTGRLEVGKLPARWAWVSYTLQLWAKLRYGLGCNASPVEDLAAMETSTRPPGTPGFELVPEKEENENEDVDKEDVLRPGLLRFIYRRMLPLLGVNRNIKFGWRHLHSTFGGIGLRQFLTEVVIARINLFLQHYRTTSNLGQSLTISLQYMQLEAGTAGCPIGTPYHPFGPLTTPCWCRSFWEALDYFQFPIHLDYPTQELPRERDELLIDIFSREAKDGAELLSCHRCRIRWNLLYLSDMVCADGKHIEPSMLHPPTDLNPPRSDYDFQEERPTPADWINWVGFWARLTEVGYALQGDLGKWDAPTHRQWVWFHLEDGNLIEYVTPTSITYYKPDSTQHRRTRAERRYIKLSTLAGAFAPSGRPCSVKVIDPSTVTLLNVGASLAVSPAKPSDFWHFLLTWGASWMWSNIVNEGTDLQWVVDALTSGTAILVTDGSYNSKLAPRVSGAGWLIYCTRRELRLHGNFYELSTKANAYRAESLGLLAVHTFAAALQAFFSIELANSKVCCDNDGTLFKSKEYRRRIPTGTSHADIQRSLRNVKAELTCKFDYEWVESHQDRYKKWEDLTIEQQLNCTCDTLAKGAVQHSITSPSRPRNYRYLLPRESAAVFIDDIKQTSDVSHDVRYSLGKSEALKFYTEQLHWEKEVFLSIDWEHLDALLETKSQMYRQWLAKQGSGFCGTQSMVARWDASRDDKCPDCGLRENAAHLMRCPDRWRTQLLHDMVDKFHRWMINSNTDSELAYWIPKYILLRGTRTLSSLPFLTPAMREIFLVQDKIPWQSFMEGKVCRELFAHQAMALADSQSKLTISSWAKKFLDQILHITHAQWIYRNVSLHDEESGYLNLRKRQDVLRELDRLSEVDASQIPTESQYLLEIDYNTLATSSLVKQSYWIYAMKAAKRAGRRGVRVARSRGGKARTLRFAARMGKKLQPTLSLGTLEVEHQIEVDMNVRPRPSDKRQSQRATEANYRSNRRWFPD